MTQAWYTGAVERQNRRLAAEARVQLQRGA